MKNLLPLFLLLSISTSYAQLTVSAGTNNNEFTEWNLFLYDQFNFNEDRPKIFDKSYELGVGYLFRLEKKRIDIHPALSFAFGPKDSYPYSISDIDGVLSTSSVFFNLMQLNLSAAIKVYPLDFNSINAATVIKKDNKVLKQGLYFMLSPGLSMFGLNYSIEEFLGIMAINRSFRFIEPRLGVGAGFDVGLSEKFTVSPFVAWQHSNGISSKYLNQHSQDLCPDFCPGIDYILEEETEFRQFQFGLNLNFEMVEY